MTPEAFVQKWRNSKAKEKSAYQEHFIDLCRLLGEPTPNEADPDSVWYCFEKGAKKAGGGDGWADVWKKGYFGMEYKGKGKNLATALSQLQNYALALHSPPLLIVCDLETIVLATGQKSQQSDEVCPTVWQVEDDGADEVKECATLRSWRFGLPWPNRPLRGRFLPSAAPAVPVTRSSTPRSPTEALG